MTDLQLQNEKTYDSVFWTSIVKMTQFLIPLINEVFGERFTDSARVVLKPGKQVTESADGAFEQGEVDTLAEVSEDFGGIVVKSYHFEIQAKEDGDLAIRIAEYGAAFAYSNVRWVNGGAEMTIPHAAVIFLRSRESTPDDYTVTVNYPGGKVSYKAPVIKIKDYTIDELFGKRLLLLLPFFPFLYEGDLEEMDKDIGRINELHKVLDDVNHRLDAMVTNGDIIESQKQHLIDWIQRVFDKLTVKYENVRKGVDEIMGGYILHTRTDDILDQGRKQGIEQGRKQGIEQGRKQGIEQGRKQGIEQGRKQGMEQGISQGMSQGSNSRGIEDARRMSEDGLSLEKIAQYVGEDVNTVKEWLSPSLALA